MNRTRTIAAPDPAVYTSEQMLENFAKRPLSATVRAVRGGLDVSMSDLQIVSHKADVI
jgi:hypothetical protein